MINIKIDEDTALNMLCDRVDFWTDDKKTRELFYKMYENLINSGCFDGCEFDPMIIVDNDYINYCHVVSADECPELVKLYKAGEYNISCEGLGYSFIEAVDDEEKPGLFLVRY